MDKDKEDTGRRMHLVAVRLADGEGSVCGDSRPCMYIEAKGLFFNPSMMRMASAALSVLLPACEEYLKSVNGG